jgi:integrase
MPKLKLTTRAIATLQAPTLEGRPALYWDTELKGLGVLVSGTTNAKTFVAQRTLGAKGATRRLTVGPVNTMSVDEARERAADMLDDLRRGIDPKRKTENQTVKQALDAYLTARKDLRPASERVYRQIERTLSDWMDKPLRDVTGDMIETKHRELAAATKKEGTRYHGTSTANGAMRTFRILWNYAADRTPDMPPNPIKRLKRGWYPEARRTGMVQPEDLPRFYQAVLALENPVSRDYILVLLFTGMRRGECATLRWTDIDFSERVIRVPATATKAKRKLDLPMSDVVRNVLVARRALGDSGFVFPSAGESGHISRSGLDAVETATGIDVSPHDLRRTYVTIGESSGISFLELKMLINHSVGNDVTSGYVIVTPQRLREAAQTVADKIKMLCGIEDAVAANVARL